MNTYSNILGGNPIYNDDIQFIQNNSISGITEIVKSIVNLSSPDYFDVLKNWYYDFGLTAGIILNGAASLISGGTINAYYSIVGGSIYYPLYNNIYTFKSQNINVPNSTDIILNNLYFDPISVADPAGNYVYYDGSNNSNYINNIINVSVCGITSYNWNAQLNILNDNHTLTLIDNEITNQIPIKTSIVNIGSWNMSAVSYKDVFFPVDVIYAVNAVINDDNFLVNYSIPFASYLNILNNVNITYAGGIISLSTSGIGAFNNDSTLIRTDVNRGTITVFHN